MRIGRHLIPLALGAAAGAAGVNLVLDRSETGARTGESETGILRAIARIAGGDRRAPSDRIDVSEQLAAYRAAQAEGDTAELERRLAAAAARDASLRRDLEIDALLGRLAELDARAAADAALTLALDWHFVGDAFLLWAEREPDAALAALSSIANARLRRDVAFVLLDVFGDDREGIDRVAAGLADADRRALTVDWFAHRAAADPYAAFREARTLAEPALQREVLLEIGRAWAAQDPLAALSEAELVSGELALLLRSAIYSEWARLDSAAFGDHIAALPDLPDAAFGGIQYLAASNPERALQAIDRAAGMRSEAMQATVLQMVAQQDPEAAMARLAGLPPGLERDRLAQGIAQALAQRDPDAALDWVASLDPAVPDALRAVAMTVAQTDFARALDLIDHSAMGLEASLVLSMASSMAVRDPAQAERVAEQLLGRDDLQSKSALQNLVASWVERDPDAALDWVLRSGAELDAAMLTRAAQSMARTNPAAAAAAVERLPEQHRAAWLAQVAGPYGRADPNGAVAWLGRYQGQDFYDTAFRDIVVSVAQTDPQSAGSLLLQAGVEIQRSAALAVAAALAREDPRSAVSWASALSDREARNSAIASSIGAWAINEPQAARGWTLNLRPGETRDQALSMLLQQSATVGDFDADLLRAFDSSLLRNQALQTAIPRLANRDPEQARAIVAREVGDANLRRQLEMQINSLEQLPRALD